MLLKPSMPVRHTSHGFGVVRAVYPAERTADVRFFSDEGHEGEELCVSIEHLTVCQRERLALALRIIGGHVTVLRTAREEILLGLWSPYGNDELTAGDAVVAAAERVLLDALCLASDPPAELLLA